MINNDRGQFPINWFVNKIYLLPTYKRCGKKFEFRNIVEIFVEKLSVRLLFGLGKTIINNQTLFELKL